MELTDDCVDVVASDTQLFRTPNRECPPPLPTTTKSIFGRAAHGAGPAAVPVPCHRASWAVQHVTPPYVARIHKPPAFNAGACYFVRDGYLAGGDDWIPARQTAARGQAL